MALLCGVCHANTNVGDTSSTAQQQQQQPTHLTGFGSRSAHKSILLNPLPANRDTRLWIQRRDEGGNLIFKSMTDDDNNNNCTCLSFSVDSNDGSWKIVRMETNSTIDNEDFDDDKMWVPVEGIYGVYQLPSGLIWVFITSSKLVLASEPWGEIRRVESMEMIYLPSTTLSQRQNKEQTRQVRLLRQAMKTHDFYFIVGDKMDMTQSLQRALGKNEKEATIGHFSGRTAPDSRFFWNEPAVQPIIDRLESDNTTLLQHVIPVTSAFVGIQQNVTVNNNLSYDEVLISRRSRFRAGTRFTKRGADATGAVANYAETEQVLLINNHTLLSHVQTRGSIPLRWSSPADVKTYRPRVRIGTDPLAQARAVQKHLLSEWKTYVLPSYDKSSTRPKLSFVNLVDKKKDQGRLGRAFAAVLAAVVETHANQTDSTIQANSVEHLWFDFHAEVKNGRWDRLGSLLATVSPTLDEHGYFKATTEEDGNWKIEALQNGVIRTNCMDCLDRTNVVQSIFGRYALYQELFNLTTASSKKKALPMKTTAAFRRNPMTLPWAEGEVSHRLLWADNADAISRLYAGTPALKGDFTRTGKRTKKGALDDGVNSLQRYYLNNFMDADRQEGMDLMTGYAPFTTLREGEEPHEDAASKFARLNRADMSLLEAARALMNGETDTTGDLMNEKSFVRIKQYHNNDNNNMMNNWLQHMGGPTLDLRWLPGDLQSHMKASAFPSEAGQELQAMDQRTASSVPWWVIPDSSDDEMIEACDDDHQYRDAHSVINFGHILGGVVAAFQAPLATAIVVACTLGWSTFESEEN